MTDRAAKLKDQLREELADLMLAALKDKGRIYLTADEHARLKGVLMDAIEGRLTI